MYRKHFDRAIAPDSLAKILTRLEFRIVRYGYRKGFASAIAR
ncbi:MAG: hypothetical protein ACRC2R_05990 [Xenococcaceae cyanobacterium]